MQIKLCAVNVFLGQECEEQSTEEIDSRETGKRGEGFEESLKMGMVQRPLQKDTSSKITWTL